MDAEQEIKKRQFWITFRCSMPGGIIEGDLVAESSKLSRQFLKDVKSEIATGIVRQNGGAIVPGMGEPLIMACLELEE